MSQITKISVDGTVYDLPAGGTGGIAEIPDPLEVGVLKVGKDGGDVLTIDSSNIPTFAKIPEVKDEIVAIDSTSATVGDVVKALKKTYVSEHTVSFGGKAPDQKVLDGDSAVRPDDPVGYFEAGSEWYGQWHDFSCWQLDGEEYDFSRPVTGDIALTAATTTYPCVIISSLDDLVAFQTAYKAAALAGAVPDGLVVRLDADIDMSGVSWESIGLYRGSTNNPSYAFTGTFDGQGHTVSNVTFADLSEGGTIGDVNNYRGFFGYVSHGTVRNLTVANAGFGKKPPSGEYGGAMVVGCQSWGSIENCVSEGAMSSATHNAAGICARLELFGVVSKCTNKANLTGSYSKIGGIVAISQNDADSKYLVNGGYDGKGCMILDCRNEGTITADGSAKAGRDGVGGIVGYADAYGWTTFSGNVNTGAIVKGANANDSGKYGQLVGFFCGAGSIGVNCCKAGSVAVGMVKESSSNYSHLAFATVDGDMATTVVAGGMASTNAKDDLVLGGTYKVMAKNATYEFKEAGRIVFDESLAPVAVTSGVSGYSVQKVQVFGRPAEYSLVEGEATDLEMTTGKVAQIADDIDATQTIVKKIQECAGERDSGSDGYGMTIHELLDELYRTRLGGQSSEWYEIHEAVSYLRGFRVSGGDGNYDDDDDITWLTLVQRVKETLEKVDALTTKVDSVMAKLDSLTTLITDTIAAQKASVASLDKDESSLADVVTALQSMNGTSSEGGAK